MSTGTNRMAGIVAGCLLLSAAWGDVDPMEKRLKTLEDEIARLKGPAKAEKAEGDKPAEPKKAEGSPVSLFYKKGLLFKSEDGEFTMKFSGYAIENGRFFAQTSANDNTFYNKETLFGWSGAVSKKFNYNIELVLGPTTGMNNSYVEYVDSDALSFRMGQWKVPFFYEETWANLHRDFAEQSVAKRLAPSRSVGVGISGKLLEKRLGYELGYFNGEAKNTNDTNDSKEFALRLDAAPFLNQKEHVLQNLHVALAGTQGLDDSKQPNFGAAGTASMADTGTTFLQFNANARYNDIQRHGISAYWNRGPAKLIGEFASTRLSLEQPTAQPSGLESKRTFGNARFDGWYVTATYVLTGEDAKINGLVEPKSPFKKGAGGGWGAWEIAGRLSGFQAAREPFAQGDVTNGFALAGLALPQTTGAVGSTTNVDAWVLGLNWTPVANAKVMLNYGENDFGSDYVGTLGADTRHSEKFILLSTQINF